MKSLPLLVMTGSGSGKPLARVIEADDKYSPPMARVCPAASSVVGGNSHHSVPGIARVGQWRSYSRAQARATLALGPGNQWLKS